MKCALWLGGEKVLNAAEIETHFDLCSLLGYYLGGSLTEWLYDNGGGEFADRLSANIFDNPTDNILYAFGRKSPEIQNIAENDLDLIPQNTLLALKMKNPAREKSALNIGGSFPYNSSFGGKLTKFALNSFVSTSYNFYGSFGVIGSFNSFNSLGSFGSFGSYYFGNLPSLPISEAEKYDAYRAKICLSSCPLNMYGYGIHLI